MELRELPQLVDGQVGVRPPTSSIPLSMMSLLLLLLR
jgi:Mrp family chromosome partitioning ATPase